MLTSDYLKSIFHTSGAVTAPFLKCPRAIRNMSTAKALCTSTRQVTRYSKGSHGGHWRDARLLQHPSILGLRNWTIERPHSAELQICSSWHLYDPSVATGTPELS